MKKNTVLKVLFMLMFALSVTIGTHVQAEEENIGSEETVIPQSLTIDSTSLTLTIKQTKALKATVGPEDSADKSVSWKSSKPEVATVDHNGMVKALKKGTATITASANGNSSVKQSIKVTVKNVLPSSIKLSKTSLHITQNQKYQVNATISPANATVRTVTWKSSNAKVAKVDTKGYITGVKNGKAVITATAKDNKKVTKKVAVEVSTKTVKINQTSAKVRAGQTTQLSATVSPADSTAKTITWKTSNKKVATVSSKGKVTGKAKGTATITASVKGAKDAKVKVTVLPPVVAKSVNLNKTSVSLVAGKTVTLTATVSPSNTANKTVKWTSSNKKIAKVSSKGKVTAVAAGTAKITATTSNGKKKTATIKVKAKPYVKNLGAGTWKGGKDIKAGRYKITTKYGTGNLFISGKNYNFYVNEILTGEVEDEDWAVRVVTTDIKAGDKIEIMDLDKVQFTRVSHVLSTNLTAGNFTVGKDIKAGKYKMTTPGGSGNLVIYRGDNLLVNEILTKKKEKYMVTSVTKTLKNGDVINISGLNKVVFTKK